MKDKTIELKDLTTGYRSKHHEYVISRKLDTTIFSGELTCLLGANGVGKSTLLRTLSAFLPRLSGEILIFDKSLDNYSDKALSRTLGVVLTDKCDIRNMTVQELVGMGRSPYTGFWGKLRGVDSSIVDEAISMVHIETLRGRMIQTLSDGERQKVMIAKALAQETPIIFLDEPTAYLDFPSKVEIMQLLHSLTRKMNKTIFLSTHDLDLALQIADKIWLMKKDEEVRIGTPEDLALNGALNQFITANDISFDPERGLFTIAPHYHTSIILKGEGDRALMMAKALRRFGMEVKTDNNANNNLIEITEQGFQCILSNDLSSHVLSTIEEALNWIEENGS